MDDRNWETSFERFPGSAKNKVINSVDHDISQTQDISQELRIPDSLKESSDETLFQSPDAMTDPEQIHLRELEIISDHPAVMGYNIESGIIINPTTRAQALWAKNILNSGGQISDVTQIVCEQLRQNGASEDKISSITDERIQKAMEDELAKEKLLEDTLAQLPEGTKFRINPHAPLSPFSLPQATWQNPDGQVTIHIDDAAMKQIKKIKDKVHDSDLTVVMSQIHYDANGELTSDIPKDASEYIELCKSFVEQSGYDEQAGRGLVLELGNECNMCHAHGGVFASEAFPTHADPEAYADFYFDTAVALKTTYPELKLSLSGTAFYDPDFVERAINRIQARLTETNLNMRLIDVISFHPYRQTFREETTVVQGEGFGSNNNQTFEEQLAHMKAIAQSLGAEVTVGEVSFYRDNFGDSVNELEMYKNASQNEDNKGNAPVTYIWPGERIVNRN